MLCPGCRFENPNGKLFCGDCGTPLNANFESPLQRMIDQSLSGRFRDQKLVEIETAVAITNRLQEWLKLFAFFVALPFVVMLGILGVTSYEQFSKSIGEAENKIIVKLSKAEENAAQAERNASQELSKAQAAQNKIDQVVSQALGLDKRVQDIKALALKAESQINEQLQGVNTRLSQVEVTQKSQNPTTILDVQKRLKDLGYYTGALNGIFDHDTQLAIVAFQRKESLVPDGAPGVVTLSRLGIQYAGTK
jgi:F0F1-type ATP synthase membrane subunit b/b'